MSHPIARLSGATPARSSRTLRRGLLSGPGGCVALYLCAWWLAGRAWGQPFPAAVTVQADQPGIAISSNLFGIFFEEINSAGDGGLYAEMVRNRSFEDSANIDYWTLVTNGTAVGQMSLDTTAPLNANNPQALKLSMFGGAGSVGIANSGYWGVAVQQGAVYDLSFYARRDAGFNGLLSVALEKADGSMIYAQATVGGLTTSWQRFTAVLTANSTDAAARLVLRMAQAGSVYLDTVSLFPRETFHNHTNGLRPDLGNMLAALKPSFMRFPGGCYVEGNYLSNAFKWKNSIGDIAARPGHLNAVWGYPSTDGLGYHEYLQLCEDLGAEPLFVVNCGMAHNEVVPLDQMGPYVQDAVDAIEYANGPTNSTWGALRAANGHPAPFNLKFMEIGNENGGSSYNDRYPLFYDAIKAQYPQMHLVADVWGGIPSSRPVEMMDEHYYSDPGFFINNATKYDGYNRAGPKVYVGEYAVTSGAGAGNLIAALGEAAFMTGMERNSDVVLLGSYAPLFANVNNKDWNPDTICFDNTRVYGTPSYYVQRLFGENRGDVVLPAAAAFTVPWQTNQLRHGAIGLGSWNTSVQYTNVVVTSNGVPLYQSDFSSGAPGWQVYRGTWTTGAGLYQQTALITDCRSTTGNTNWADYVITLRARKVAGSEGFLILFNWLNDNNWTWWNIGGWNNSQHAVEYCQNGSKSILGTQVPGQVTTNRWYDIRIELNGTRARCYLDGVLIHDVTYPASRMGAVGLGTWNTAASYTNVAVTQGSQVLYLSDFSAGAPGWTVYRGTWSTSGGCYRQTSAVTTDCRSTIGNTNWSDYTLSLKARKDSGSEGFLILFNWRDDNNWTWWNIGGWGNTKHGIEVCQNGVKTLLTSVNGSVTNNGWYDVRIELNGARLRCYLNNTLIHDVAYASAPALVTSASYKPASGQVILKAINSSGVPFATQFAVNRARGIAPDAKAIVLTSGSPLDENSLAQPFNVFPVTNGLTGVSTNFSYTLPANSLTILRLQARPDYPVGIGLDLAQTQQDLAVISNGIPVRLSSFITNAVSVNYTVDSGGVVLGQGTLQFAPGDLVRTIPAAWAGLQNCAIVRVTLSSPSNGQLTGITRAYYVRALNGPADPPVLAWARFPDETVLFWSDGAAGLLRAPAPTGPWTAATNVASPLPLGFPDPQQYYRLKR